MHPRWYQTEAVKAVFNYFQTKKGHPLVVVPTGGGKSFIIAEFLRQTFEKWPDQKIVCLTHQKELVRQNEQELLRIWPNAPVGVFSAGLNRRELRPITFASIQSIWRMAEILEFDLVLIDEAHLVPDRGRSMYRKFLDQVDSYVVGFTATPFRLGTGMLTDGELFTDIAYDCKDKLGQLIREGYLTNLITKQPRTEIDVSDVGIRAGEFLPQQLREAVDREAITHNALTETLQYKDSRKKWLVFAIDIEHAEHINDWLNDHGIKSGVIHSKMNRDEILDNADAYQALVNVNMLTTGYNDPRIDLIVLLRPTASPVLHVQMIGRGFRVAEGKENCLILDFAGNTHRLGPINDVHLGPKRKGDGNGKPFTKTCPKCSSIIHAASKTCSTCGHEFQFQEKISSTAANDNVVRLEDFMVEPAWVNVDSVEYSKHIKRSNGNASLKLSFQCGLQEFYHWVSFKQRFISSNFWLQMGGEKPYPDSVDEALERTHELAKPARIRVDVSGKYPKVVRLDFESEKEADRSD